MTTRLQSSRAMRPRRPRRGIALFVAMFFVAGVGALALSAIYLTANASLLGKSYEKEDDLKYVSEAALAIGKSELNFNPAVLPNSSYVQLMTNKTLTSADNQPVPGITVNLYAGPTGNTSGQFGRFASIVAEARDANGTGFVRRLEMTQESFAKFAYWSNSEGSNIVFGGGDQLFGPVWSNDTIQIASSGAGFHEEVGTAGIIQGANYGTFAKGYSIKQKKITLPALASLTTLSGLAAAGGMSFTSPTTGDETTVRIRVEFVAADMDANGDSTGDNEGFFRVYQATAGNTAWLRGDWNAAFGALPSVASTINCGDWHAVDGTGVLKFFPAAVHSQGVKTWFDTLTAAGLPGGLSGATIAANVATAHAEGNSGISAIMMSPGARCYLGGDPHLAAIERDAAHGYTDAQMHIGGDNNTFTPSGPRGDWKVANPAPQGAIVAARAGPGDAKYLYPLYRGFNTSTKGVMYFTGTVGVSGVLRGDITLYSPKTIVVLDDLRYANDPAKGVCIDILGLISGANTVVADNGVNSPETVRTSGTDVVRSLDDTPNLDLHAVIMALGNSFTVENFDQGSTVSGPCQGTTWGRGCLYLTGGIIQQTRGAVATLSGTGFLKRYSYDRCAVSNPPPYFPTTGRFLDNRYYELDPVRFNVKSLFQSLTPG
jgi:hypothetical protein